MPMLYIQNDGWSKELMYVQGKSKLYVSVLWRGGDNLYILDSWVGMKVAQGLYRSLVMLLEENYAY